MSATTQDTKYAHQLPFWEDVVSLFKTRGDGGYRGVFWFGAPGPGKTFIANAFCKNAKELKFRVFQGSALELVAETQAAIGKNRDARDLFTMHNEIKSAQVVFLDDLGREREDYGQSVMFSLLDVALSSGAFVLVTANRSAKELADYYKGDAGLRSRLSALRQQEWGADLPNLRKPVS